MSRTISHQSVQGQPASGDVYRSERRVRDERWTLSPGRIIGGIVGAVYLAVGIAALVDAGIDSTLTRPVVDAFGLDMSAAVAIGITVAGLLLLLGAAMPGGTALIGFVGVVSVAAGVFFLAATAPVMLDIGVARNVGWFTLICGLICIVAMFFGTTHFRRSAVREDDTAVADRTAVRGDGTV